MANEKKETPPGGGERPAVKQVPERDLLAVKEQLARTKQELSDMKVQHNRIQGELTKRDQRVLELESGGDVDLAQAKWNFHQDRQKHLNEAEQLENDKKDFQGERRRLLAQQLATEYQVDVEELLKQENPDQMKITALELKLGQPPVEKPKEGAEGSFEGGIPSSSKKSVMEMNDADFEAHTKKLRDEALSKV